MQRHLLYANSSIENAGRSNVFSRIYWESKKDRIRPTYYRNYLRHINCSYKSKLQNECVKKGNYPENTFKKFAYFKFYYHKFYKYKIISMTMKTFNDLENK